MATEKGADGVHLLSSHAGDVPASSRSPQPACPAGFQSGGGVPQPDSSKLRDCF